MRARGCLEEINYEIIITKTECAPDGINNFGRLNGDGGGVIDTELCVMKNTNYNTIYNNINEIYLNHSLSSVDNESRGFPLLYVLLGSLYCHAHA